MYNNQYLSEKYIEVISNPRVSLLSANAIFSIEAVVCMQSLSYCSVWFFPNLAYLPISRI